MVDKSKFTCVLWCDIKHIKNFEFKRNNILLIFIFIIILYKIIIVIIMKILK